MLYIYETIAIRVVIMATYDDLETELRNQGIRRDDAVQIVRPIFKKVEKYTTSEAFKGAGLTPDISKWLSPSPTPSDTEYGLDADEMKIYCTLLDWFLRWTPQKREDALLSVTKHTKRPLKAKKRDEDEFETDSSTQTFILVGTGEQAHTITDCKTSIPFFEKDANRIDIFIDANLMWRTNRLMAVEDSGYTVSTALDALKSRFSPFHVIPKDWTDDPRITHTDRHYPNNAAFQAKLKTIGVVTVNQKSFDPRAFKQYYESLMDINTIIYPDREEWVKISTEFLKGPIYYPQKLESNRQRSRYTPR